MKWSVVLLLLCAACSCGEAAKAAPCDRNEACEPGQRCVSGGCVAIDCAKEQYWNAAAGACFACPAAQTSPGGIVTTCAPVDCARDTYWRASTRSCTPCPPGSVSEGGTARTCAAISCAPDHVWSTDARACIACDPSTWSAGAASASCLPIACGAGEHWSGADQRCVPCEGGRSSEGGAVRDCAPIACRAGERWDAAGRRCSPCDSGETSAGGSVTACTPISCSPDGFWNASMLRCETCPAGTSSPGGVVTTCDADRCPPETARVFDGRCVPCPAGAHSAGGEATLCDASPCAPDRFWNPVRGECLACEAGRSSDGGFPAACTSDCAPVTWSAATTLAGDRTQTEAFVDGPGGAARFADVTRLRWDRHGKRIVAYDGALRAIATDGAVTTLVTAADLVNCALGEGPFDVDGAGGLSWFCAGPSTLVRREADGRVVSFPVLWPGGRSVRAVSTDASGSLVVGWSTRLCQDTGAPCWQAGLSRIARDGGVTDLVIGDARPDLGGLSDLSVTGDGVAYVVDPETDLIHRFQLSTGTEALVVDGQGATVAAGGRRIAVDAAGRLHVGGRVVDAVGAVVGAFPTTDAGDAVALTGSDDDLVRSVCRGSGGGRRCELALARAVCAP